MHSSSSAFSCERPDADSADAAHSSAAAYVRSSVSRLPDVRRWPFTPARFRTVAAAGERGRPPWHRIRTSLSLSQFLRDRRGERSERSPALGGPANVPPAKQEGRVAERVPGGAPQALVPSFR